MTKRKDYQTQNKETDDSINFKELLFRYLKLWRWFLLSLFISFFIAYTVNKFTPPAYKIESKYLISPDESTTELVEFNNNVDRNILPQDQKIANETIILRSRVIADAVLTKLKFDVEYYSPANYREGRFTESELYKNSPILAEVDWDHNQLTNGRAKITWNDMKSYQLEFLDREYSVFVPGKDKYDIIKKPILSKNNFAFGEWLELPYARFQILNAGSTSSGSIIIKFRDRRSLLFQYTGENLEISPISRLSSVLLLSLETNQPQKGRDYLNTLMLVFLDNELKTKNAIDLSTINFIDNLITGISDSLDYTENQIERYQTSHRTYNITNEGSTIFQQLSDLERQLEEEKYKKEYYENLQNYLINENYSGIVVPSGIGIDDPVLNRLIEDLIVLQSDKSRFLATQTESSPTVLEVNRKINDLNISIKEVLRNVTRNTNLLIADLEERIVRIESQFGSLPETEQDLTNIRRSYTLNENLYTFLLQRRAQSSISLASNKPSNQIIEYAVANFEPLKLKPLLNYFLAILLGLILPMIIVSLNDIFAVNIKNIEEIEHRLKVPVIGKIGHNKDRTQLVAIEKPRFGIAESFRAIKTDINFIIPKEKQLTVMITSNISGEGKTFTAINLASTYSISKKRTILVGCDLHKSFKFEDFKVSNKSGLSTYLAGQIKDMKGVIQITKYENLDILVPGPIPPNPAELLTSDRFGKMLEELKKTYDVIILDSSPLGLTHETLHLTRFSDFCIFVLRQNYSKKTFLDEINKLKDKKGIKNLYVILNDINKKYLRHGGYGYGYYAEDNHQPKVKKLLNGLKKQA